MAHALPLPPPGFDELPVEDQIDYIQSLWDRIAVSANELPLQDWQARILDDRLAKHRADPTAAMPADEVMERLSQRFPHE